MNDDRAYRLQPPPRSLPARLLGFLLSAVLLVLAAMFSLVALAVVAVGGLLFAGCFWWKTRALRRQLRTMAEAERPASGRPAGDAVIDGEWVREEGQPPSEGRLLN